MNKFEHEVLEMVAGKREWAQWGAWLGECMEFLKGSGYITDYTKAEPMLTDRGRDALDVSPSLPTP